MANDAEQRNGDRATLNAVATLAGVSSTTVSLVLAGKGQTRRISGDTHRKVLRAAEELNYAPNLLTRSLRGGRTHILSFYSTYRNRDQKDLYINTLSSSIEAAGGLVAYDILVHCNFDRSPKEIYQFLNGGFADGLILLAPGPNDPLLALLRKSNLPVVFLNRRDPQGQYPSVSDNVELGMRLVADEIASLGHRTVAALGATDATNPDSIARIHFLRTFLAEKGIEIPDHLILPTGDAGVGGALKVVLSSPQKPTLVFCWHDRLAYAFISACESRGISIPHQLSVIGYDGLHWPSRTSHLVSSVKVDFDALALSAVRLLDEVILGSPSAPQHHTLPVSFIRGTSVGATNYAMEP